MREPIDGRRSDGWGDRASNGHQADHRYSTRLGDDRATSAQRPINLGGGAPTEPASPVPWHPDVAEFAQRVVRRVIRNSEQLPLGRGDLLTEPVLVGLRRPGKQATYDISDAFGRQLATAQHRRPRFRGNADFGAKAVSVIEPSGATLALKLTKQGSWQLSGGEGSRIRVEPDIPEDLRGIALEVFNFRTEHDELAQRIVLPEDLAIATRRFSAPITDSIEIDGKAVAVIETGSTAPVKSPMYPGLEDGAPWRVLCRLKKLDRGLTEAVVADWLSPAHGP